MQPRRMFALLVALTLVFLVSPTKARAGCTATLNCNNACNVSLVCYNGCEIACFANATVASCTGNSSCTVGASSVTCDGTTVSCPTAPQCSSTATRVRCGSLTRYCPANCPK